MSVGKAIGKVVLAGAGPGDPELITVKALRFLRTADVVLVDRLVSPVLITHARHDAKIIYVGKKGWDESTAQAEINDLLVEHALAGELVLRLKGGDVAFFSNVFGELTTLVAHSIPFEIIPGVTAASGASAYAGIPLTARGYAQGVRFISIHHSSEDVQWNDLASTDDTLVFYMTSRLLDDVVGKLKDHRISDEKKIAVIEQATTVHQRVSIIGINEYPKGKPMELISPTLIIIGRVVALHEQFRWFDLSTKHGIYFQAVEKIEA